MSEIIVAGLLRLDDWRTSRSCTSSTAGTLLAMRDGVLPPTINVDEPDPNCDLDYVPDIGRKVHVELTIANCIAFGSKNSAMLLRWV